MTSAVDRDGTNEEGQPAGLSGVEAAIRVERFGPNEIPSGSPRSWVRRFAAHVLEPMSILLLVAAVVEGPVLGERLEAIAILAIVVLNAVIGTVQEGRAQRALDALRSMEPRFATVIRDGRRQRVALAGVVPGDRVVLAVGDRVPADMTLVETNGLEIDESVLTGESLPVEKLVTDPEVDGRRALAGTIVTRGEGVGLVDATGAASSLGRIAAELTAERTPTPLQRQLTTLSRTLGLAALTIAAAVFLLTLLRMGVSSHRLEDAFLSSVALAVAAVPEGLPAVVTVVLALGVRRMAERGAIIRRLPAVETLGSATVILTDKTGTLTENRMEVDRLILAGEGGPVVTSPSAMPNGLAIAIALGSDATIDPPTGDPLEIALLEAVGPARVETIRAAHPRIASRPFDPATRRTVTLSRDADGSLAIMKGAPEGILELSRDALVGDDRRVLDRGAVMRLADELASSGSRMIAFASREGFTDLEQAAPPVVDFSFLGLVALRDPVRTAAAEAVAAATLAGIRVAMVTGDHAGTAAAVARDVGVLGSEGRVVVGADLEEESGRDPSTVSVYARVLPEEKLGIVRALQERGETVAVTGDGVNDAPALRQADIGVAMGRTGSDVAREAADLVITDDHLGTIVDAVQEGRRLYGNIRKVIDYLVAGNLSEIAVVVTMLVFFPTEGAVLTPLQLLWINLLTDGLPAIALGAGPGDELSPGASASSGLLTSRRIRVLAVRAAVIASATIGTLLVARFALALPWQAARTTMFTALVVSHLLYAFVVFLDREARTPSPAHGLRRAPGLLFAVGVGIFLQLAAVALPFARQVFDTSILTTPGWVVCILGGLTPPLVMRLATRLESKIRRRGEHAGPDR